MGDPPLVRRPAHELFVDVVGGEIAGDPGEAVHVMFADGFRERGRIADRDVEFAHMDRPFRSLCTTPELPYKLAPWKYRRITYRGREQWANSPTGSW